MCNTINTSTNFVHHLMTNCFENCGLIIYHIKGIEIT